MYVSRQSIAGTRWEIFNVLVHRETMYVVSSEPNVQAFFKITKKIPEITLLGE